VAFSGSDGGSGRRAMTDINVTPLVDVMLVLLIIFMVTAPLIQSGVKVDLPRAQAQQMEHAEEKLVLNARVQKDKEIYLQADRSLPYGLVVQIMATARRAGVESLGMITEPEKELTSR